MPRKTSTSEEGALVGLFELSQERFDGGEEPEHATRPSHAASGTILSSCWLYRSPSTSTPMIVSQSRRPCPSSPPAILSSGSSVATSAPTERFGGSSWSTQQPTRSSAVDVRGWPRRDGAPHRHQGAERAAPCRHLGRLGRGADGPVRRRRTRQVAPRRRHPDCHSGALRLDNKLTVCADVSPKS